MKDWKPDKRWSDKFISHMVGIIRQHVPVKVGNRQEDVFENSDLVVLRFDSLRVACRVRRHKYHEEYGNEFTIRAGRPTGTPTELIKMMSGWGQLFLYGISNAHENGFEAWHLLDLGILRAVLFRQQRELLSDKYRHDNKDGSSWFFAWPYSVFPEGLIVAKRELSSVIHNRDTELSRSVFTLDDVGYEDLYSQLSGG